jgi:hypothetical protein
MPTPLTDLAFSLTPLPNTQWNGDIQSLLELLVNHLVGELADGVFVGQVGGSSPLTDVGFWFDTASNTWQIWDVDSAQYLPLPIKTGSIYDGKVVYTRLQSTSPDVDSVLFLPSNRSGATLATMTDVVTPAVTKTASGTAINLDWKDIGNNGNVYINLTGNATLTEFTGPEDGQRIDVWFEQALAASGALTVTWPSGYVVQVAASVLQTRSSATTRYIDHFILRRVGSTVFVEQGKTFQIPTAGAGSDTTAPTVSQITVPSGSATVTVQFNEALMGGTLDKTKWTVKKNGVSNTVNSATASGNNVILQLVNTYGSTATGTVAYSGSDVKDIAGNAAATFTAQDITVLNSGTDSLSTGSGDGHSPPGHSLP